MALATGDCHHEDWKTPAASAVPLTEEPFVPRHWALRRQDGGAHSELHKTDTKIHHVGMCGAGFQQTVECIEEVIGVMSGQAGGVICLL